MYKPTNIRVIRDVEKDEKGRLKNDGGFFLLKYEIDDKYDVTISAHANSDKVDKDNNLVENEFESISVETTIRYHGEKFPRMKRSYKQKTNPLTEGFGQVGNYSEQLTAKQEFVDIMEYVENNIVGKVFNIVYNEETAIAKNVEKEINEIFFEMFGGQV